MIIVCYDHTIQSIAPDEALKNSFFIGTISFHMPLFMILSGYFINPKRMRTDKITTSCFSKFKHLMVPAFSWYIIQCCLFREIPEVKASLESYWFLSCLFFCFCILAIITKITTNNLIVFTVACIITYFTPYCYFVKINFLMPFLAIGYWLNKHNKYLTWQLVLPILMIYIILYQHWTFEDSVYITPIRFHKFSSIIPISHIAIFRFAIAVTGSLSIIYGCILITKYFKNNILIKKLIHYGKYTLCTLLSKEIFSDMI
ncbi:MAG: acyltransferase family protein [Bacteroides uniformis]